MVRSQYTIRVNNSLLDVFDSILVAGIAYLVVQETSENGHKYNPSLIEKDTFVDNVAKGNYVQIAGFTYSTLSEDWADVIVVSSSGKGYTEKEIGEILNWWEK